MNIPLLETKIQTPQVRHKMIPRERLIDQLNQFTAVPLILISAPSGFGKTSLLSAWAGKSSRKVCWYSIDAEDNDIHLFLKYLLYSFSKVCRVENLSLVDMLGRVTQKEITVLLTQLLNDIVGCRDEIAFIIDDYHLIETQEIHDALNFLVQNAPSNLQIIVSGRTTPPWKLAQLRAASKMRDLGVRDLRFTPQESKQFFQMAAGIDVSPELLDGLEEKFEGWPAGLQMAALSIGSDRNKNLPAAINNLDRMVADSLLQEIFDAQPEYLKDFLKAISIVDIFSVSLCEALTGHPDCSRLIAELDKSDLFIISLDHEKKWYRFHQLFLDFLREQRHAEEPQKIQEYHIKASHWFEQQGMQSHAIKHAARSGDVDCLNDVLQKNIVLMLHEAQQESLKQLFQLYLPEGEFYSIWVHIAYIWQRVYSGNLNAEAELDQVERSSQLNEHIQGHIAGIRGYCAIMKGLYPDAVEYLEHALAKLRQDDYSTIGLCKILLGSSMSMNGDLKQGETELVEAIQLLESHQDFILAQLGTAEYVANLKYTGKLHKAAEVLQSALQKSALGKIHPDSLLPAEGYLNIRLSMIAFEWGELEKAESLAKKSVQAGLRWGQEDLLSNAYGALGLIYEAQRKFDLAIENFKQALDAAKNLPVQQEGITSYLVLVYLRQGVQTHPERWLKQKAGLLEDEIVLGKITEFLCLAEILISKKDLLPAIDLLERMENTVKSSGAFIFLMRVLILKAKALLFMGESDSALEAFQNSLEIALPEDIVKSYVVWGGPEIVPLLEKYQTNSIFGNHVKKILQFFPANKTEKNKSFSLTRREKEIVELLANSSLSPEEIAKRLNISIHTLRTHTRNIYRKLGVHNRREAVRLMKA